MSETTGSQIVTYGNYPPVNMIYVANIEVSENTLFFHFVHGVPTVKWFLTSESEVRKVIEQLTDIIVEI